MAALRSILFAIVFYPVTGLAAALCLPAAVIGERAMRGLVRAWAVFHRYSCAWILGIRSRVEGDVPAGAVLVAGKHQSMFETIEIVLILKEPAVVVKRELADLPFWGWACRRYGCIPVDRAGGAQALRALMRGAEAAIAEDRPIVIFPEGTRVSPGEAPPLQSGFAGLYRALGLPVVPLALDSGRLWPRHRLVKEPGIITMRFDPPLPAGLKRREIEAQVHRAINALEPAA